VEVGLEDRLYQTQQQQQREDWGQRQQLGHNSSRGTGGRSGLDSSRSQQQHRDHEGYRQQQYQHEVGAEAYSSSRYGQGFRGAPAPRGAPAAASGLRSDTRASQGSRSPPRDLYQQQWSARYGRGNSN
jgi:hypothetical protein